MIHGCGGVTAKMSETVRSFWYLWWLGKACWGRAMTARPFGASRRQLADELTRECLLGGGDGKIRGGREDGRSWNSDVWVLPSGRKLPYENLDSQNKSIVIHNKFVFVKWLNVGFLKQYTAWLHKYSYSTLNFGVFKVRVQIINSLIH